MQEITRTANAEWNGNLKNGTGHINTTSGVLKEVAYSYATRFEDKPGTNPEELLAAAHAACFNMAFSGTLAKKGYTPVRVITNATCIMTPREGGGWKISKMRLDVKGEVPGLDAKTFKEIAEEAEKGCPVSNLLRPGLEIELVPVLSLNKMLIQ